MRRHEGGKCSIEPAFASTSLGVPLTKESAHAPRIHEAWPKAVIQGMGRLATAERGAERGNTVILNRREACMVSQHMLSQLRTTATSRCLLAGVGKSPTLTDVQDVRFVAPYHPIWDDAFGTRHSQVQMVV